MFIDSQSQEVINEYKNKLKSLGSLSRLFSENEVPFLHYRLAENLFCDVFSAENHSRSDTSADASIGDIGFAIKTFISERDNSRQKIAEFDSLSRRLRDLRSDPLSLAGELTRLRNDRISTTFGAHGINNIIYHIVARRINQFLLFEESMDYINEAQINIIGETPTSINFEDGNHEYSYNFSKSTLYKYFQIPDSRLPIDIEIIESPFDIILGLINSQDFSSSQARLAQDFVILPLYSTRGNQKNVQQRSGLNQWNAHGRARDSREVYIPIPIKIHRLKPGFFPPRETSFSLKLPNGRELDAKVCQANSKALMSNPNKDLGHWMLDVVLRQPRNKLVIYDKLLDIGLDSVMVTKIDDETFEIEFKEIGSYERFINQ